MTITPDTVIKAAAFLAAVLAIGTVALKIIRWVDEQKKQSEEIKTVKDEQQLLTYGVLACLKGLAEQGCNGPVHEAIDKLEKHLNEQAHR